MMLDDDIVGSRRVYIPKGYPLNHSLTAKETSMWIDDLAEMARAGGFFLFGFSSSANPVGYTGANPFKINKYIPGACLGILKGHKLHFPNYPHFVGEDYWIAAYNAFIHRKSLIDNRIGFTYESTEANVGGCSDFRTEQKRKETYIYLKKHFGNSIIPKLPSPIKPKLMKWEKTLKIPF